MIKCNYSELKDPDLLVEHPRNANKHGARQIELLAKIIDHTGFRHPIVVSKLSGYICAGHGRLMAAKKLGLKEVPVEYQEFKNEAEEFQFLIADNKISILAEHDDNLMIDGIKEFQIEDFELLGLDGFEFKIAEAELPDLSDKEKGDLEQITFTLHKDQAAEVKNALEKSKSLGPFGEELNTNSNGNGIARICEWFLNGHS